MAKAASTLAMRMVNATTRSGNNAVKYATPRLKTFWSYAKVELRPPTLGEMPQVQEGFNNIIKSAQTGKFKTLTIKEAWLNTLIGAEIMFCFFIGEVIGR